MSQALKAACGVGLYNTESYQSKAQRRYEYLLQYEEEFKRIFGKDLYRYCNPVSAFDSLQFCDEFYPEVLELDGVSYASCIRKDYGIRAAELIMALISSVTA